VSRLTFALIMLLGAGCHPVPGATSSPRPVAVNPEKLDAKPPVQVPDPGPFDLDTVASFSVMKYSTALRKPLNHDCGAPRVLVQSTTEGVYWQFVVQAIVAHDHVFRLVRSLDATGTPRDVSIEHRRLPSHEFVIAASCRNAETCNELARMLRGVSSNAEIRVACGDVGTPVHHAFSNFSKLVVFSTRDEARRLWEESLNRVSACLKQQGLHKDLEKCDLSCAAHVTCYDVVECVGAPPSSMYLGIDAREAQLDARFKAICNQTPSENCSFESFYAGPAKPGAWLRIPHSITAEFCVNLDGQFKCLETNTTWSVAFLQANGHVVIGPVQTTNRMPVELAGGHETNGVERFEGYDFDGDGIDELMLTALDTHHTLGEIRRLQIWKFDGHDVVLYPPTAKLPLVAAEDVDGDGRPDLILDKVGSYTREFDCHTSVCATEHWELAHSLKDGTFSETDSVAQEYRRKKLVDSNQR
jgi:hypothetical protein